MAKTWNSSSDAVFGHRSVLLQETVAGLAPVPGGVYLDATFGGGGHSLALLAASAPDGIVLGLDRDAEAIRHGETLAERAPERLILFKSPMSRLAACLGQADVPALDGALFDLGVSSRQLDTRERGFSFQTDGPLDMRMDGTGDGRTAADLVNDTEETELANLIYQLGEERQSRRVARAIVRERAERPFETTGRLAETIRRAIRGKPGRIDPATRTFQAIRMAVNNELGEIETALDQVLTALKPGGRIAVISFHSLEDRLIKTRFRKEAFPPPTPRGLPVPTGTFEPTLKIITRKPIIAGDEECRENPRARSAKLRIAEKVGGAAP